MTDDALEQEVNEQPEKKSEETKSADKGSGFSGIFLPKSVLMIIAAVVLVGASVGITLVFTGAFTDGAASRTADVNPADTESSSDQSADSIHHESDPKVADQSGESGQSADSHGNELAHQAGTSAPHEQAIEDDTMLQFDDPSVMEGIMASLEFLDYSPEQTETSDAEITVLTKDDSVQAHNWLKEEKKRLSEWEDRLSARERELELLNKKISQKVLKIDQAESARTASLAKLYDNMDPRSVVKLMTNLDDETVVSILPRMKQKNASQVLALMPAKRAARLSEQMITIASN